MRHGQHHRRPNEEKRQRLVDDAQKLQGLIDQVVAAGTPRVRSKRGKFNID